MQMYKHDQIASLAYRLWEERGCPSGSPEVDWERAIQMLEGPSSDNMATLIDNATASHEQRVTRNEMKPRGRARSPRRQG